VSDAPGVAAAPAAAPFSEGSFDGSSECRFEGRAEVKRAATDSWSNGVAHSVAPLAFAEPQGVAQVWSTLSTLDLLMFAQGKICG
jgi:hypothetical protein